MSLQSILDDFYEASGTTSELARNLAFAGIAMIWILKGDAPPNPDTGIGIPNGLLLPLFLFALALAIDLTQYIWKSVYLGWLHYHHEKRIGEIEDTAEAESAKENQDIPHWMLAVTYVLFYGKQFPMLAGYACTVRYLWRMI